MTQDINTSSTTNARMARLSSHLRQAYANTVTDNNAAQALHEWLSRCRAWWMQRPRREQGLLTTCAVLLALTVLWLLGLRPALRSIDTQQAALPALRAEAAYVQSVVQQAKALAQHRVGTVPIDELDAELQASLRHAGLDAAALQTGDTNDRTRSWTLSLTRVPAPRLIVWLSKTPDLLQLDTRLVDLQRSMVEGRERPGMLDGTIVLARAVKGK